MSEEQPGLRMRMRSEAQRIAAQHARLDSFYGRVCSAIRGGVSEVASDAFANYRDALESHFAVEERVFFPALRGLRPELDTELADLVQEHSRFRRSLRDLERALASKQPDAGLERLEALAAALAAHELREEKILATVNGR